MSRKYYPADVRGMALVMVLVFSSALLLLGAALLTYSFNEKLIADYQQEEVQLYYITEAGLEAGLAALRRDFFHNGQISGPLNGGSFKTNFATPAPGKRGITSEGALGRYRKTITLIAEQDLLAGSENLTADEIYLHQAEIYGSVHVNQLLIAEGGQNMIVGDLFHHDTEPPLVAPGSTLEVSGSSSSAAPLEPAHVNFEQLAGRTTRVIPGGLLFKAPADYPAQTQFLVEGDLLIAPQAGDTFDFSGLLYVQGDLALIPAEGSTLLLDGAFAVQGSVTIQLGAPLNPVEPLRHLIILAGGEIEILPPENSLFQLGGKQILYSRSAISIRGRSPDEPLVLRGVSLARQLRLENCALHYEPALLHSYAELLPGLGTIRVEWIKP